MAFETTSELYDLMQQLVGDRNPTTTTRTLMLGFLDDAHKEIVGGGVLLNLTNSQTQKTSPQQFAWIPKVTEVITIEPFESNTITVTNGSASATLGTSPAASRDEWMIEFDGSVYRITANTGTSVTLDSNCASASGSFEARLYKLEYSLSTTNIMRLLDDPFRVSPNPKQIGVVSEDALTDQHRRPPHRLLERIDFKIDADGNASVIVGEISNQTQRLRLTLVQTPSTLDLISVDPILPPQHRKMIAYLAAFYLLDKRDDTRAQNNLMIARGLFQNMCMGDRSRLSQQGKGFFGKARLSLTTTWNAGRWLRRR